MHIDATEKSHESTAKESKEFSSKERNDNGKGDSGKIWLSLVYKQEKPSIVTE